MMSVDRRKVEDWLARCWWLATTKLDDRPRARLDCLIDTLEQDLEADEFGSHRNAGLTVRRRADRQLGFLWSGIAGWTGFGPSAAGPSFGF
jgi:hypothetical protein